MSVTPAAIIEKKRDGRELGREELKSFIAGVVSGEVAHYQAAAFLMAVYFKGMTLKETVALTEAMVESGERYDLSAIPGPKVDKHSTGGVGDKVSLILAPLAAACGLKVPMMSGRGLGHSGGTLDKLESISGFDVNLKKERFEEGLLKVGIAMIGQSESIAPADRVLYALRDVTGTVECVPLIVASILSKKIAEGTGSLVLDVKTGSGAFMKSRQSARILAKTLIGVGDKLGLPCRAILSGMDQPLGYAVGNALEVRESIEVLAGGRKSATADTSSSDLRELTLQLCSQMLTVGKVTRSLAEGRKLAQSKLADGSALKVFQEMVRFQGGDLSQVTDPDRLPQAPVRVQWGAPRKGFIARIDTAEIGRLLVELGGGRRRAEDKVDPSVGFVFHRKLGAKVDAGEPIVTVHAPGHVDLAPLESRFHAALLITSTRKAVPKLILDPSVQ